ncbi:MAG: hypothetical protein ACI8W8_002630 [Rhodothermales bacterium]|jgi:hypothetical protein
MDELVTELPPPLYHQAIYEHLQRTQPELWDWLSSTEQQANYTENVELDLLKTSYRLAHDSHPALYDAASAVAGRLGITVPVTLYQSQVHDSSSMNAQMHFLPGGVHIVFIGPVTESLDGAELRALLGHEMAHHLLFTMENGAFLTTERLVNAMASDPRAEDCHIETCRRYLLYMEIFADRGGALANDDIIPAISCLVKVGTGMAKVDPHAYLEQAREVMTRDDAPSQGFTHPECHVRARALELWSADTDAANEPIHAMIAGSDALSALDVLEQYEYTGATRRLLQHLLEPIWFRSDAVIAQAKTYFADFAIEPVTAEPELAKSAAIKSYFAFILLDFALVDRDLEDVALARCMLVAEAWDCAEIFAEQANSIAKMTKKQLAKVQRQRDNLLEAGAAQEADDD